MKFGVFDHLDRAAAESDGAAIGRQYEDRLALTEIYDRLGFYAYHVAEHHGTPLGLAPSPNLFLASVAQRTTRLRIGAMVYVLSMYHPLRLLEEICMLDQLSGGRLELGIGRGASPVELDFYHLTPTDASDRYAEVVDILLRGASHHGQRLSASGPVFPLREVPIELAPVQRPHPPLWYGVGREDRAKWAAGLGINMACNGPAREVRALTDTYRATHADGGERPLLAMSRHVVVSDSDAEARELARPAYRQWHASLTKLWRERGVAFPLTIPESFDEALEAGYCLVGAPATVRKGVLDQSAEAGINYLLCRFAFGNLSRAATERSVQLFAEEIMPSVE
jgi:alkanesulfonate monooxygenase SsuD/methylene tetrahydromethanopterin reductase-like flavin-dependent oxidoreductase (luciferase family)